MALDIKTLKAKAQECWEDAFISGPYSNLLQAEYLVNKSGQQWSGILANLKVIEDKKEQRKSELLKDESTSFIRTCNYSSPCFDFKFYDLGHHRVARCAKTGILIDSSSAIGILVLNDGDDWTVLEDNNTTRRWKWRAGVSNFDAGREKKSGNPLSIQQCMAECLTEISNRFEPLCLFRSFKQGRASFHGMIKWVPKQKQLHLIKDLKIDDKDIIAFGKNGSKESEARCRDLVSKFIDDHGGPEGKKQWRFGQEDHRAVKIHDKIWSAAIKSWGNTLSGVGQRHGSRLGWGPQLEVQGDQYYYVITKHKYPRTTNWLNRGSVFGIIRLWASLLGMLFGSSSLVLGGNNNNFQHVVISPNSATNVSIIGVLLG